MKGGFRAGSGRKPGTKNKNTKMQDALMSNRERALAAGIPEHFASMGPLETMSFVMTEALAEGNKQLALSAASQLAPYVAPKLSHVVTSVTDQPAKMSDNELARLLEKLKDPEPKVIDVEETVDQTVSPMIEQEQTAGQTIQQTETVRETVQ